MIFYIGRLETENFEFTAYAETEQLARELLENRWQFHKEQTDAWLEWEQLAEWVTIEQVKMNKAYRR